MVGFHIGFTYHLFADSIHDLVCSASVRTQMASGIRLSTFLCDIKGPALFTCYQPIRPAVTAASETLEFVDTLHNTRLVRTHG